MNDDTTTDPYNGELPNDADLGGTETEPDTDTDTDPKDDDAADDAAHLLPDGGGLESDGDGSGALP